MSELYPHKILSMRLWLILLVAGVAVLGLRPHRSSADGTEMIIVSIGDSLASGDGAPDNPLGAGTVWNGWSSSDPTFATPQTCHRSNRSGPALAYSDHIKTSNPTPTFVNVGCSGASIYDGLLQAQHNSDGTVKVATPQLQQVKYWMDTNRPGRRIDALFLSIGAADLNYKTIIDRCANVLNPFDDCTKDAVFVDTYVTKPLAALDAKLDILAGAIQQTLNPVQVYITQYPDPVWKTSSKVCDGEPWGDPLAAMSGTETRWLSQSVIAPLNNKIWDAVGRNNYTHGWRFVGYNVYDFSQGHGYCAKTPWINTAFGSLNNQGDFDGSMYPNHTGYEDIGTNLANAYLNTRLTPAAPSLSLTAPTYNSVQLKWEDHSLFQQVRNEVQVTVGGTTTTQTLPANSTSWSQSGLTSGLTYTYQVRGCTNSGCAPWSQLSYTVPAPPPPPSPIPAAPSNLKDTATVSGSVYKHTLSWTLNSTNQTSIVLKYQEDGTTTWNVITMATATTTQFVLDSRFKLYHAYTIYVQACNANGCSTPSNSIWVDIESSQ